MKRILSMLLAIVMVCSMIPVAVSAAEVASGLASADADTKWTYAYTATADGTLTITVGDGSAAWASDIYLPATFKNTEDVLGTEEGSYTYDVTAGTKYTVRIFGQGSPSAAIADIPYSIVFTSAAGEEEPSITVYGNVMSDNNGVAMKGTDVEIPMIQDPTGQSPYAGQQEHFFTPAADGILTVHIISSSSGWWYSGENLSMIETGVGEWAKTYEVRKGTQYSITLGCYEDWTQASGTISYEILFYEKELESQKEEYIISDTVITTNGDHTVTMEDLADMTVVTITPTEVGVYTISVPAGTALLNNVGGGSFYIEAWDDTEAAASIEWTCQEVFGQLIETTSEGVPVYSQGQSLMLGIKSEAESVTVNVAKTGEYVPVVVELQKYFNSPNAVPPVFTLPQGAVLGAYVNIDDEVTHTAVKGEDGYYHLDSADGDILLVDMDYDGIVLTEALSGGRGTMYASVYNEEGELAEKWDIGDACTLYYNNADENKYYPLTDDLIFFYDTYAVGNWVYGLVLDQSQQTNEDVWMYCMRTMSVPALGSIENPIVYETMDDLIADWTEKEVAGGETIYFTAPLGGETLNIDSTPYQAVALVNTKGNLAFAGEKYVFEGLEAGAVVTVGIYNQNPGAAEVVTLSQPVPGSLETPIVYESVEAMLAAWEAYTVPAGATVYITAPLGGETLTVTSDTTAAALATTKGTYLAYHGEPYTFGEDMGLSAGDVVTIGIANQNPRGAAVATLTVATNEGSDIPGSGTLADPYVYESVEALVADWQERMISAGTTVYVSAPLGGETLTVTSNSTAACLATAKGANIAFHGEPYTFSEADGFTAGQVITIGICNQDPYDTTVATLTADTSEGGDSGDVEITYTALNLEKANAVNAADAHWVYTAPAEGVLTLTTGGAIMGEVAFSYSINNGDVIAMELSSTTELELYPGDIVKIDVAAAGYSSLTASWAEGAAGGDEITYADLTIGNNSVDAADAHWIYTAPADGVLTLTTGGAIMGEVAYTFSVNDGDAVVMELSSTTDINLSAGDVVKIDVAAAGYSSLTAAWSGGSEGGADDSTVMVLGDNEVSLEADDMDGQTWTFTAAESGTLYATLTYLQYWYESYEVEGEFVSQEVYDSMGLNQVCGRLMQFLVNGSNAYTNAQSVEVEAGDEVTIQLISNYGYRTDAIIALEIGEAGGEGGGEAGEPDGSDEHPFVIDALPYEGTYVGGTDVYYAYTVGEAATLLITVPADAICSGVGTDYVENGDGTRTYTYQAAAGEELVINPWGGGTDGIFKVELSEGETPDVPGEPDGTYNNPYILDSLYGTLNVEITDAGSTYYQYTATEDGMVGASEMSYEFSTYFIINGEWYPYGASYKAGDVILIEFSAWNPGTYEFTLFDSSAAKLGDTVYASVEEALAAAAELNEATVTLMADVDAFDLMIAPGVTLDLNGYKLAANYVAVFNGAHIVDTSAANTGLLAVGADSVIISKNNAHLPIVTEEGYIFIEVTKFQEMNSTTADGLPQYIFLPHFETIAHQYLAQGMETSRVKIAIRMTWDIETGTAFQNFVYNDATVKTVIDSFTGSGYTKAFYATITDSQYANFDLQVILISDTGVELALN